MTSNYANASSEDAHSPVPAKNPGVRMYRSCQSRKLPIWKLAGTFFKNIKYRVSVIIVVLFYTQGWPLLQAILLRKKNLNGLFLLKILIIFYLGQNKRKEIR